MPKDSHNELQFSKTPIYPHTDGGGTQGLQTHYIMFVCIGYDRRAARDYDIQQTFDGVMRPFTVGSLDGFNSLPTSHHVLLSSL